ncbi:MAG: N-methyl-L-tryptophan oxidase [Chitinophagaceae bacterium]|nr:N-methyl-L-tryptophan oxidase [Chitinophagaceae bacterium]
MNTSYDIAIIGAGAMGSAAAYHLSKTGKKVLVLDRFAPPHNLGSSHGESRIIREAYYESPVYVPLVQQAYDLWHELEEASGKKLLLKTGGIMLGGYNSKVVQGALRSALQYHLPYEYLTHNEIKRRFPGFKLTENTVGIYEERGGVLFPEQCIHAFFELTKNANVNFRFTEIVKSISASGDKVEIVTEKGNYTAAKAIISSGAWMNELLPDLQLPLTVARQVLFWFNYIDSASNFLPQNFPIYIWQYENDKIVYGFPDLGTGIKIAIHHGGKRTEPNTIDRNVDEEEINAMQELVDAHFDLRSSFSHSSVCMYTNTPDEDFIIDYHPLHKNIIIASPCSGHGFKFSIAIAKLLCDMILESPLDFDISVFSLKRFVSKLGKEKTLT